MKKKGWNQNIKKKKEKNNENREKERKPINTIQIDHLVNTSFIQSDCIR